MPNCSPRRARRSYAPRAPSSEGDHPFLEGTLKRTVELIRAKGGEAKAVTANVSIEDDCIALVQSARDYGPVDILVNNAALTYYQPITEMQTNRWFRAFAVDVHGPFMLAKEVLKDMIPRRSGAIINISSGSAIGPGRGPYADKTVRGGTMYGAVKAALERFTQGLAQEVAQYDGITVAAVSPSQSCRRRARSTTSWSPAWTIRRANRRS